MPCGKNETRCIDWVRGHGKRGGAKRVGSEDRDGQATDKKDIGVRTRKLGWRKFSQELTVGGRRY
jgi:hypothetical protein